MDSKKKELVEDNGIDELMELVKAETKLENLKHRHKVDEIDQEFARKKEMENIKFDHDLQLQRIKNADIKRTMDRKANRDFMEGYSK
jgi:hypothetical protein